MILNQIQGQLQTKYDLVIPYDVATFVSHDPDIARTLCAAENESEEVGTEVVFLRQEDDCVEFTLYLDKELLQLFDAEQPSGKSDIQLESTASQPTIDEICTLVEGVSHAVCLLWHAHNDRQIRPVDLELQAEIDKFMMLLDICEPTSQSRQLHHQLFDQCHFTAERGTNLYERYRIANNLAARYCLWLMNNFISRANKHGLETELARFYRLSGSAKFERIRQLH